MNKKMSRTQFTMIIVVICLLTVTATGCTTRNEIENRVDSENDWPSEPITVGIAGSAGGGTDRSTRIVLPFVEKELGVPIIADNRPGGSTITLTESHLFDDPVDGQAYISTLTPQFLSGQREVRGGDYTYKDVAYIANVFTSYQTVWVREDSEWETLEDLICAMKEKELSFAYIPGSWMQAAPLYFADQLDVKVKGIPYPEGGAATRAALIGGHVDFNIQDFYGTISSVADQVRALGVFTNEPLKYFPDVPLVNEELNKMGIDKKMPEFGNFYFVGINKKVKEEYPERYQRLVDAYRNALNDPELTGLMVHAAIYPDYMEPEDIEKKVIENSDIIAQFKELWVQ